MLKNMKLYHGAIAKNEMNFILSTTLKWLKKTIKIFVTEKNANYTKKKFTTNKTDVQHIADTWARIFIRPERLWSKKILKSYRYILAVLDKFIKMQRTVPLKNDTSKTTKDSFENKFKSSKRKPNSIETDDGKRIFTQIFF